MDVNGFTTISECDDLLAACDDVETILQSMCTEIEAEPRTGEPSAPMDRKTKNRLSAQLARAADKEYVSLMFEEIESLTQTFEAYTSYIMQLKVHATKAVDSMSSLERKHEQNKVKISELVQQAERAANTLIGVPTKVRNRIHAQTSRQRKHEFVQDLIKQRDESLSTIQDVKEYTTALEGICSVLHDFDDTGFILLQLTETRHGLLMRTSTHTQKYEELESRLTFRAMCREKNAS
jgi:hypothetical protein